jgi:hypothetical protein
MQEIFPMQGKWAILSVRLPDHRGGAMSKKKYRVRAECPACACGDITFLGPEKLREKFIGDEKEIDITCPMCGTKHKGQVQEEKA